MTPAMTHLKSLNQKGFTLVEIAIVLVIVGLLLGGVMKGQELINSAKTRALVSKLKSVEVAWDTFKDRYQAKPGDFNQAVRDLGGPTVNGNGDGFVTLTEANDVWSHLSIAGLISGNYAVVDTTDFWTCVGCMENGFGQTMVLSWNNWGMVVPNVSRHRLLSGYMIPSTIVSEVDKKIDDGKPTTGVISLQPAPGGGACFTGTEYFAIQAAQTNPENCAFVYAAF